MRHWTPEAELEAPPRQFGRRPTLVIHRTGDQIVSSAQARFVAEQIPGARYVELPGSSHIPFLEDADAIVDEIEEFLTGARPAPRSEPGHGPLHGRRGIDAEGGGAR